MNWTGWLILAVTLVALYLLGLVLYRLYMNAVALKAEIEKSQLLIAQAQQFEKLEIAPAKPSSQQQLAKLMMKRRKLVRSREKKAEDRQRRLVQRVRDIEIDKR